MASPPRSAEAGLSLSEVTEVTGVPSRQIIYLRERGVVLPSEPSEGRGHPCRYSADDAVRVFIAGNLLSFLDYSEKLEVVNLLAQSPHFPVMLNEHFALVAPDAVAITDLLNSIRAKAQEKSP